MNYYNFLRILEKIVDLIADKLYDYAKATENLGVSINDKCIDIKVKENG